MQALEVTSKAFELHSHGDLIVVAKRKEGVVEGIVHGIIVDLLAFPLFGVCFLVGIWILVSTLKDPHQGQVAPQFDHFASPAIVHGAAVVLQIFVGIMFSAGSLFLGRFLLKLQFCLFPLECRLKKGADGRWSVQQKVWFISLPWRRLSQGWLIRCRPAYLRGDWGYAFFILSGKTLLRFASSGAYTESKREAEIAAKKDLARLCDVFAVRRESIQWA